MLVRKTSPLSGQPNTMEIDVTDAQIDEWQQGGLIQDVMPHLSADECEFLMTGIPASEWSTNIEPKALTVEQVLEASPHLDKESAKFLASIGVTELESRS